MSSNIFLIRENGDLVGMDNQIYESEKHLQDLLAKHPSVLSGQSPDNSSARWLLVSREMAVPSPDTGINRWSVDHLFLDESGVPTLVEVKRSTDSRIRREVVGQMLDYAANAVAHWPIEKIRESFLLTCQSKQLDPDRVLEAFLNNALDVDDYWKSVKTNLQAGRIRLVFLADVIPIELRRIVEFLNEQMDPAEVLAVEVKQYTGDGQKLLVSNVIGQTSQAQQRKQNGPRRTGKLGSMDFIRQQVEQSGRFRIQDGLDAGYKQVTLTAALSDLKNPKYCGRGGVLILNRTGEGIYTPEAASMQNSEV